MTARTEHPTPLDAVDPTLRDLPPAGWPRLSRLLGRAFALRCPECGGAGIFAN